MLNSTLNTSVRLHVLQMHSLVYSEYKNILGCLLRKKKLTSQKYLMLFQTTNSYSSYRGLVLHFPPTDLLTTI